MDFQFYVEKLFSNEHFEKFKKENKGAFCSGAFFVIDKEGKDSKQHFDYWIEEFSKLVSFKLESGGEMIPVEVLEKDFTPQKIPMNLEIDFDDFEKQVLEKMNKGGINNKLQKILISVQMKDKKPFLLGTVFISMMGMIKVVYDLEKKDFEAFEKRSFLDIMKVKKGGKK